MSDDFGRTGIDPEWYDNGAGSEAAKRRAADTRAKYARQSEQQRQDELQGLREKIERLQAIVGKLRSKCGELSGDLARVIANDGLTGRQGHRSMMGDIDNTRLTLLLICEGKKCEAAEAAEVTV